MTDDPVRWRRLESVVHAALARPAEERAAFLAEACRGDDDLRREAASLLEREGRADGFLGTPLEALAAAASAPTSALTIGQTIAHYRIVKAIGAGGMGEVFLAEDTRLDRQVALKILPLELAGDPERRIRFTREAKAVAALNHPNIVTVYAVEEVDGLHFMTMELVRGRTLAELLPRTGFVLARFFEIAIPLADALGAAHQQGITHRDLKPTNVMVNDEGRVTVLDFGLARVQRDVWNRGGSLATRSATEAGHIVGTPGYMSPEQTEGKPVDPRSDIFSLGIVCYEMLTGERPFSGDSHAAIASSILKDTPRPVTELKPAVPRELARLVHRCLAKNPIDRFQSAIDLRHSLEEARQNLDFQPTFAAVSVAPGTFTWKRVLLATAVVGVLAAASAVVFRGSVDTGDTGRDTRLLRATVALGPRAAVAGLVALTPDGTTVVYPGVHDGRRLLFRRRLGETESQVIAGTQGASDPAISPDGHSVAFYNGTQLMKVPIDGGPATAIAPIPPIAGASWGDDGFIVTGSRREAGLLKVPVTGGTPQLLTTFLKEDAGNDHRWPQVLPGGRGVLFSVSTGPEESARIVVLDGRSGTRKDLVRGSASAKYVPTGHLVYARSGSLFAVDFDLERLEISGTERLLVEGVEESTDGEPQYAISAAGDLVYVPGWSGGPHDSLVLVDIQGKVVETSFPKGSIYAPRFSPKGDRVALLVSGAKNNVWTFEINRGVSSRATFGRYHFPVWTPDGRLTMSKGPPDEQSIVQRSSDDGGETDLTGTWPSQTPGSWTPDGRRLFFVRRDGRGDLDVWSVTPGSAGPSPVLVTPFNEQSPRVSPDGRWLLYVSDETGRNEAYVRPTTGSGGRARVSSEGAAVAVWASDGRRIFYRGPGPRGSRGDMWVVNVDLSAATFDRPRRLFAAPKLSIDFDIDPKGTRFAMVQENPVPLREELGLLLGALTVSPRQ